MSHGTRMNTKLKHNVVTWNYEPVSNIKKPMKKTVEVSCMLASHVHIRYDFTTDVLRMVVKWT